VKTISLQPRTILTILLTMLIAPAATAQTLTSAEKLGFGPRDRVVIIGVTHFGWAYETNAAVAEILAQPDLRVSAEVMVVGPWFDDVKSWRKHHPEKELGVMLTLLSEGDAYRFGPAGKSNQLAGLIDEDGRLPGTLRRLEMNASPQIIERELRAQIDRCLKAGIRPTHLMTHKGVLFSRVDLAEIYLRLAQEFWIPAVVVELKPEMLELFASNGMPVEQGLVELIEKYPLPKLDELRIAPEGDTYEAKRAALLDMISQLPPGLSEIYFRAAEESNALKRLTPRWRQMVWDRELLLDPAVRGHFQAQGIILTDWHEVMQRFEGTLPPETPSESVEDGNAAIERLRREIEEADKSANTYRRELRLDEPAQSNKVELEQRERELSEPTPIRREPPVETELSPAVPRR